MSPARKRRNAAERRKGDERRSPRRRRDRFRRHLDQCFILIAIGLFAWGWVSLQHQSDQTKGLALQAHGQAAQLKALVHDIQQQRRDAIYGNCVDQNRRHDATVHSLDALLAAVPPARRTQAREGRTGTVLLINSLAPRRDCGRLVQRQAP